MSGMPRASLTLRHLPRRSPTCRASVPRAGAPRPTRGVNAPLRVLLLVLLHSERAARLAREELAHELVVRVEQLLRGTGLHDASLPQDRDVLGHAAGGHDVVGDHDVRPAVLLV